MPAGGGVMVRSMANLFAMRKVGAARADYSIHLNARLNSDARLVQTRAERDTILITRRLALVYGAILWWRRRLGSFATDKGGATKALNASVGVDETVGIRHTNLPSTTARLSKFIFARNNTGVDGAVGGRGSRLATDKGRTTKALDTRVGVDKTVGVGDANLSFAAATLPEFVFTGDNTGVDGTFVRVGFTNINTLAGRQVHGLALTKDVTSPAVLVQPGRLG